MKVYLKERLNTDKDYNRRRHYRRRYGVTVEFFEALKTKQNGCCAICSKQFKRLVLDHCHKTGKVRQLLCVRCNVGLHYIETDGMLDKLLLYVKENE